MRVLVVDDEPSITEALEFLLRSTFAVRVADGVRNALREIAESQPNVLLTDLGMDDGGGEYLLAAVAAAHPDVLRIVHSAASLRELSWVLDSGLADVAVPKGRDTFTIGALILSLSSHAETSGGADAQ